MQRGSCLCMSGDNPSIDSLPSSLSLSLSLSLSPSPPLSLPSLSDCSCTRMLGVRSRVLTSPGPFQYHLTHGINLHGHDHTRIHIQTHTPLLVYTATYTQEKRGIDKDTVFLKDEGLSYLQGRRGGGINKHKQVNKPKQQVFTRQAAVRQRRLQTHPGQPTVKQE